MIPTVESREVQDTVAMASTAKELFKFLNLTVGSSASDEAATHCSPWCKKRAGFWRGNFKK